MRSIHRFLIIVLLATVTLVNFLAALHGYRSSLVEADALFDKQLLQMAGIFEEQSPANVGVSPNDSIAYQIWHNQTLIRRSSNATTTAIAPFEQGFYETNFNQTRWRVAVVKQGNDRWIQVAEPIDDRFILAENVINESVIPLVLSVPLIGILIWLIVRWGLWPLQNLAQQLQQKHPDDLSPIRNVADTKELQQLVLSVNNLLGRLSGALERESRFAANAAHELRTPLSVLKVHLYNLRKGDGLDEEAVSHLEQGIDRLSHLVEQILALHLSSQDRNNQKLEPLNLVSVCRDAISDNFSMFSLKHQDVELIGDHPITINANIQSLRILLDNLLTNASKYTPAEGNICITLRGEPTQAIVIVEDSGPGIPESEREQVFERFYRIGGDQHSSGESGCGLGLSVVKQVVNSYGATIVLGQSAKLGGLSVTISFPL